MGSKFTFNTIEPSSIIINVLILKTFLASNVSLTNRPLYNDTSYVRALGDVQKRVKESGKYEGMQKSLDDINIFYRRRRVEDIGAYEKAAIRARMYKGETLPDFDVGYATVHREFCPVVKY